MPDQLSVFLSSNEYSEFIENQTYHDVRLIKGLDSSDLPYEYEYLIELNTVLQMQLLLRRSKSLFNAIDNSIRSFNFIQLALCVRAHYEIVGSIGYLFCNLKKYINGEMDVKEIDELLGRMNLGNKQKEKKHPFEPINVLTMIDSADKMLNEYFDNKECILRDSYNWLSEFCHPNCLGLIYSIEELGKRKVVFRDNSFTREEFNIAGYANISFPLFFLFYDNVDSLIKGRSNMPKMLTEV